MGDYNFPMTASFTTSRSYSISAHSFPANSEWGFTVRISGFFSPRNTVAWMCTIKRNIKYQVICYLCLVTTESERSTEHGFPL